MEYKTDISVTVLTKNSEKYLENVLKSLEGFSEIVVYDTGSSDSTLAIAKRFPNVSLFERPFEGFGLTHNKASDLAKYDWILSIDSDEVVTPEMRVEIAQLILDENCVYSFPRNNYYNNKWIRWCGWYPDRQIRLYHRRKTRFTEAQVHESILADQMKHVSLKSSLIHYSYDSVADFLSKMQSYSDLFAKQYQGKKSSSVFKAICHGLFAFIKSYFLKKGFLGGREGFEISFYNANTALYKYLKLLEANLNAKAQRRRDNTKKSG
jgi:glycosyltransferase involved in cell wall biosynthesis